MWTWHEKWTWPEGAWPRGHVTALNQSQRQQCVAKDVARRGACSGLYILLSVLKFEELFEWNPATQTRGHALKLYEKKLRTQIQSRIFLRACY